MSNAFLKLYLKLQALKDSADGQDLVEYGLLVSLIALVCISGIGKLAGSVTTIFSNISTSLG